MDDDELPPLLSDADSNESSSAEDEDWSPGRGSPATKTMHACHFVGSKAIDAVPEAFEGLGGYFVYLRAVAACKAGSLQAAAGTMTLLYPMSGGCILPLQALCKRQLLPGSKTVEGHHQQLHRRAPGTRPQATTVNAGAAWRQASTATAGEAAVTALQPQSLCASGLTCWNPQHGDPPPLSTTPTDTPCITTS